jgi:hypothetical protein
MTISFKHHCQPAGTDPPAECSAEFTVNGLAGNQKFQAAGPVTLEAVDQTTNLYKWEVISSPPDCDNLLTRITPYSATLRLPRPGAYVVELTVCKEDCSARTRYILWVVTPNLMYCIPATNEPLRFDGKEEWAGDLARVIVDVDRNLPTNNEKDALHGFNEDYPPSTENPYATREDLIDRPGPPGRQLTDDEIDAIKAAEDPNKRNPFITQSALPPPELTKDQKEAIEAAEDPNKCNPFITESALPEGFLDGPDGPFVTQVEWAKTAPTEEQKKAMDGANEPGEENPFATHDDLPSLDDYVTRPEWLARAPAVNEKQALQGLNPDTHSPSDENRYVTKDDLSPVVIDPEADFVTREEWLARAPEVNEKQALAGRKEHEPGTSNPYITEKDLSPVVLDPEADFVTRLEWLARAPEVNEKQALAGRGVYESNGENPYLTEKDVSPIVIDPEADFVTRPEWLARAPEVNEKQALQGINPDTHPPSDENRYITKNDLSPVVIDPEADFVTREEWQKTAPSEDEKAALQGVNPDHQPNAGNRYVTEDDLPDGLIDGPDGPYVTREEWEKTAPSECQKEAMDGANGPGAANPFATQDDLPNPDAYVTRPEWLERAPAVNEKQALAGRGEHEPGTTNPYITEQDLSPVVLNPKADFVTRSEWLERAPTTRQKSALNRANNPHADNPFATLADLRPIGEGGPQIVAAGMVDLSATTPDGMFGGLRVVRNGDGWGMATLSFDGYALSKQQNYVIKALPVNAGVRRQKFNEMIVVQFVEFQEDGFVLQMSQPFVHGDGRAALGPCMVEVTELMAEGPAPARVVASGLKIEDQEAELMAEAPSPSLPNLADAIEDYYNAFIAAGQYAEAWPMLSDGFKAATGLTTLEEYRQMWEQSGPAILLGFEEVELTENEATLILDLDYRQSGPIRQTCHFVRDEQEGHPRFGYWLFERQEPYHNSDLLSYRPTKTTPH